MDRQASLNASPARKQIGSVCDNGRGGSIDIDRNQNAAQRIAATANDMYSHLHELGWRGLLVRCEL
jgi:hypothetical protein